MNPARTTPGSRAATQRIATRLAELPLGWLVALAGVLLALRKPWALHTPQLWAEDGSIFLVQDEQLGLAAWWHPYNGYLHLIPRMIAWIARHTADVAWWPAIYNGLAFVVHLALFARLASDRVALPHKGWLMLAWVLVVGTGEVLINVTNLQWITAFFLVLQLFTRPPATLAARLGDMALLAVVGLNGPFALALWPLFAARAWCDRTLDTLLALAVVSACAFTQGLLLAGASLQLESGAEPFDPLMAVSVLGSRLVTWPIFGPAAVRSWPVAAHAALAIALIVPLLGWALRPHVHRPVRAMLVAAFVLVTLLSMYRVRADTWADDTLVNGDRYFYIPRALLAWLLILEFDARPRFVAWTARGLCLLGVMMHLPHFIIPAPPDYEWARHCDPIRRGDPANIRTLPEGWWIEYPGRR